MLTEPLPVPASFTRDARWLAVGSIVSTVAAYALLLVTTQKLGDVAAAPVALLWSFWLFATTAVGVPVQQWMVRSAAVGVSAAHQRRTIALHGLSVVALAILVTIGAIVGDDRVFPVHPIVYSLCLGGLTVGSFAMGYTRGRLAAASRYALAGSSLAGENLLRLAIAVPLLVVGFGARAVGFALVAGGAISVAYLFFDAPRPRGAVSGPGISLVASLSIVAILPQLLFASVPFVLSLRAAPDATVTTAFVALSLMRIPNVLTNAVGLRVLSGAAELVSTDPQLLDTRRRLLGTTLPVVAALTAGLASVAVMPVVELLFGVDASLESFDVALFAFGAILAVGVTLLVLLLAAYGRVWPVVGVGLLAVLGGALAAILIEDPTRATATGFALAESVFFVGALVAAGWVSAGLGSSR